MYNKEDYRRQYSDLPEAINEYETAFESDVSRLLLSASFRRLVGKAQLFPSNESDFFRNRLTHSLEVEHIAQLIRKKISKDTKGNVEIDSAVLRFACYAHDLGHPPFGHSGERKLNKLMEDYGGFEGNAQTLRILTCLEKGLSNIAYSHIAETKRGGLNITFRSLASIIKNNRLLDPKGKKGYYETEHSLVEEINETIGTGENNKTIECYIMDLADDISNAVHDLEDSLKGNFITAFDIFLPNQEVLNEIISQLNERTSTKHKEKDVYNALKRIFQEAGLLDSIGTNSEKDVISQLSTMYKRALKLANNGFERSKFIKALINKYVDGVIFTPKEKNPALSEVKFNEDIELEIQVLKKFHRIYQHQSSQDKISSYRGGYMIEQIFNAIDSNHELLPKDFHEEFELLERQKEETLNEEIKQELINKQKRIICDFISGMTDRYCVEFYGKLYSEDPKSYFKPIN